MEQARLLSHDRSLPVQVCEGTPDSAGRWQGLCVLLLHSVGATVADEFQRGLLHSCPSKHPGGVRSAALRLLAGTSGSGGATGGSERLTGSARTQVWGGDPDTTRRVSDSSVVTVFVFVKGTAQVSLADCEGSAEMGYHWLRVQMLSGMEFPKYEQKNLSHRRHHDNQEEEQRLRTMVNKCTLCVSCVNEHEGRSMTGAVPGRQRDRTHDDSWKLCLNYGHTVHNHHWNDSGCCRRIVTKKSSVFL